MTIKRHWIGLALIVALSGSAFAGCGGDDNDTPTDEEDAGAPRKGGKAGKGGSGGKGSTAGKGGAGGRGGSGGSGGKGGSSSPEGGTGGTAGSGGKGGGGSDGCKGDKCCYSCEPKTYEQHLNACTDAVCNAYDNSKLKKL